VHLSRAEFQKKMNRQVNYILDLIWITRWDDYLNMIPQFHKEVSILFRLIIDTEVQTGKSSSRFRSIHESFTCFIQVLQIIDDVNLKWRLLFQRVPASFELDSDLDDDKENYMLVVRYTNTILSFISEKNIMMYEKLQYIASNDICHIYDTILSVVKQYEKNNSLKYSIIS